MAQPPTILDTLGPRPAGFDMAQVESTPTFLRWRDLPAGAAMVYRRRTFTKKEDATGQTSEDEDEDEERLIRRIWLFRKKDEEDGRRRITQRLKAEGTRRRRLLGEERARRYRESQAAAAGAGAGGGGCSAAVRAPPAPPPSLPCPPARQQQPPSVAPPHTAPGTAAWDAAMTRATSEQAAVATQQHLLPSPGRGRKKRRRQEHSVVDAVSIASSAFHAAWAAAEVTLRRHREGDVGGEGGGASSSSSLLSLSPAPSSAIANGRAKKESLRRHLHSLVPLLREAGLVVRVEEVGASSGSTTGMELIGVGRCAGGGSGNVAAASAATGKEDGVAAAAAVAPTDADASAQQDDASTDGDDDDADSPDLRVLWEKENANRRKASMLPAPFEEWRLRVVKRSRRAANGGRQKKKKSNSTSSESSSTLEQAAEGIVRLQEGPQQTGTSSSSPEISSALRQGTQVQSNVPNAPAASAIARNLMRSNSDQGLGCVRCSKWKLGTGLDWNSSYLLREVLERRREELLLEGQPNGTTSMCGNGACRSSNNDEGQILTQEELRIFRHLFDALTNGDADEIQVPRGKCQGGEKPVYVMVPCLRKLQRRYTSVKEISWLVERMCLDCEVPTEHVVMELAKNVMGMKVERQKRPLKPRTVKRSEDSTKSVYVRALSDAAREFLAAHGVCDAADLLGTDNTEVRRLAAGYIEWLTERGTRFEDKGPPSLKDAMERVWHWKTELRAFSKKTGLDPFAQGVGNVGSGGVDSEADRPAEGEDKQGQSLEEEDQGVDGEEIVIGDDGVLIGTSQWVRRRAAKRQRKLLSR